MIKMTDKKQGLQDTFDTVAKGYDHPTVTFFPETAQYMLEHLNIEQASPTTRLLDVCTGTGVVALQAASLLPQGSITGIDLSDGMLTEARAKADLQHFNNVNFMQMDLDYLDFPDQHFDIVTCSFGLFFLEDMESGLRNMVSKVKTGGKIAISTFNEKAFEPMSSRFLKLYTDYGYEAPPLSWKRIATDEQLTDIFSRVGVDSIDIYRKPLGIHLTSAESWWDIVWNAGYRGLLNKMTSEEQDSFKAQHLEEIQRLCDLGDNWLDTGIAIAIGEIN